jgi:threonine/homoserine/homoserine lactone efflux protein
MLSSDVVILFLSVSLFLAITPGPDNLYVLMQSAVYGYKTGVFITLGLCTGLIIHSMAVALGLATLLQTSSLALPLLKFFGASYLVYLAWQAYRAASIDLSRQNSESLTPLQFYRRGIIMNVSNPKIGLFFLAFLPQFTDIDQGDIAVQTLLLGGFFIIVAFIVMTSIALIAGSLSHWLIASPKVQKTMHRLTAIVLLGLALHIALLTR